MTKLKLAVFGDAGNSFYNANSYYYKPGWYELYNSGGTAPVQDAVARMMRGWGVSELIQLGDTSYNAQSSSLLDYNIGKYYNDYMQPYGNRPNLFAYANSESVYSTAAGGLIASPGKTQWPYNYYNFPYGFPNPGDGGVGGSDDGLNHFWALQGNHDYGTIIGAYYDFNVNQVNFRNDYIGLPEGPDAYDYQNNIIKTDFPAPKTPIPDKIGSAQQLLDYLPYLQTGDDEVGPSYLKAGQVHIGSNDPQGYDGIYYSVDLGETVIHGIRRPLLHVVMLDTPRIMTDAGYYDFNNKDKSIEVQERIAETDDLTLRTKNYNFNPTDPKQIALFPNPDAAPQDPSASYRMFQWARRDLARSNAVWKVVTGHHTAYHGGAVVEDANSNNFSSPIMVKLLAGLKDKHGQPLLDAYWNGHSHAYSRVLEMGPESDGIGAGIPLLTTGNGGKDQDSLNLVPYGSNVLEPQNWTSAFTYTYKDKDGQIISGQSTNAEINGLNSDYLAAFPQKAHPISVGTSGPYRYNKKNIPAGFQLEANPYGNPDDDPALPATYQKTIDAQQPNAAAQSPSFQVTIPQYNSVLPGATGAESAVSGLYGYGSGAAYVEVDDGYLFMNYRTTVPLDPALTLLGKQQGLKQRQMQRGSLFFEQWSPSSAKVDNLALFSFDIIIDASHPDGYLDHLQLVQSGDGYLEKSLGSDQYDHGTYTIEIQGNNPASPLASDQSDPSRAAVELTFEAGKLTDVRFARDAAGHERKGTGYRELANAVNGNNYNLSSDKSMLVGININLEAQYTFADQAEPTHDLYQDWYLLADTSIQPSVRRQGPFGTLGVKLKPSAKRARQIIADQAPTTGYSGEGPQAAYANPQQGVITVRDALGNVLAGGVSQSLEQGHVAFTLPRLPAPGPLQVAFDGDPYSSYLVNYKAAATSIEIGYGEWSSAISSGSDATLQFSHDVALTISRSDSGAGRVSFGLLQENNTPRILLHHADPASDAALNADRLFTPSGADSWLASERQPQGGTRQASAVSAGRWQPLAMDADGNRLPVEGISLSGNTAQVDFAGGIQARYSVPSTGTLASPADPGNLVMTVQRLGAQKNGLALYEADPVTGAISTDTGAVLLPGAPDYLASALRLATAAGLRFEPDELPAYREDKVFRSLPLDASKNYGLLLLRRNDPNDIASSYSRANPGNQVIAQSFAAPGRGICFGIEDLHPWESDADFNDLNVILSTPSFSIL